MSQNGWVKSDFGTASLGSSYPITKQQNGNSTLYDSSRIKRPSGIVESLESIYTPTSSSELAVQKKKISEVKHWLEKAFSTDNQAQFLLLTGPPGCGKYQTLRLICNELHIDVLAWEEPIKHYGATEWDVVQCNPSNQTELSQIDINFYDHLEEFLERASRFSTLRMRDTRVPVGKKAPLRKVLLLKDFPPMIFQNLERWRKILLKYGAKGKTPAVFILTNSKSFNSMQLKLFPHDLQERLKMSTINFSGLANTFVLKALQKVAFKSQKATPHGVIQGIAGSCNGDFRSALNAMNWINTSSNIDEKKQLYPKKRKLSSQREKNSLQAAYVRDGSIDFMHAIGKVLHSKRLSEAPCNSPALPQHLLDEFRMPLKEDVNALTKNIGETSSKVLLFLHHNYPVYFNRIEDISKAVGYLSSVDSLCSQLAYKEIYEEYSLLTAIRGLMFSNTSVNGSSWRPLGKPDHFSVILKQQELRGEMLGMNGNQYRPSFFSETLPFMRLIRSVLKITGSKQDLEQVDDHKSDENPMRTWQAAAYLTKPLAVEDSKLPHSENAKSYSEEDADIIIEEYEN